MNHDDMVSTEVVQRALKDSGLTATEASKQLGWDATHLRRMVGESKETQKSVSYAKAAEFVQGLGLWPVDYGI